MLDTFLASLQLRHLFEIKLIVAIIIWQADKINPYFRSFFSSLFNILSSFFGGGSDLLRVKSAGADG